MFCKKGVLGNFTKLTEKHLCQSLFLIKLQAWHATLLKRRLSALAQVFSCEFCEISKNTFSYRAPLVSVSALYFSSSEVSQSVVHYVYAGFGLNFPL